MATWITLQPPNSSYLRLMPSPSPSPALFPPRRRHHRYLFKPFRCVPLQQQEPQLEQGDFDEAVILCEDCNGKGWLLCDFCNGQKTNVKSENNRIYRRCPTCKAVGFVLCRKCKVFKCVTYPNSEDGDELMF
ncbi:Heat shock protein DnaJ cysteine-rich domain superfamily [Arabidopsis suecica]|uniref:Heat shock protein DnaJ cysteine-rich domain superfamily n=1 Tax=Arabidopsis suecica TaxID=45249 RepID=A0A8T2AEY4_ARASU|nr:Heat shock protein DnaJ cysteine-rich domain superfamily [Arabidopsis suecica]